MSWLTDLANIFEPLLAPAGWVAPDIAQGIDACHNSGAPSSRTRVERVRASLFGGPKKSLLGARKCGRLWALEAGGASLRDTAWEVLKLEGYDDPDAAFASVDGIPQASLHCRESGGSTLSRGAARAEKNRLRFLRTALVLGKCCKGLYDPSRPVIWTEGRLGKRLELYQIAGAFYFDSDDR